jgi:N-acetylglutamate synthase-like GNAT family acetyltransferase
MAAEFDCMTQADVAQYAELHKAKGLAPLAKELFPELTCLGLLTNLAIAPERRRTGLGRALCEWCEAGTVEWSLPGLMLQVEEENHDARALYGRCGFDELFKEDNGRALRPRPGRQTRVSALLLIQNAALLEEVPSTIVMMAKEVGAGGDAG